MAGWIDNPNLPAWIQAGGSLASVVVAAVTVVVAVWIPARQRANVLRDAVGERERQRRERTKHLVAGLRAEVAAAKDAAERRTYAIAATLAQLKAAAARGAIITGGGRIEPGSMAMTEAIIYRQIAANLGLLPADLIERVVMFYTLTMEAGHTADGATNALEAYDIIQDMAPRVKMHAAWLVRSLDMFEAADFALDADVRVAPNELRDLAAEVGYPIEEIARERGIQVPPRQKA